MAFGLSRSFWLSFACLAATGATDTVSMVFRNLIRQLETPDHLRGRMTGVNMVFFMGGPQLGELEAGLVANWFGAVASVVSGGIGCMIATAGSRRRRRRCGVPPVTDGRQSLTPGQVRVPHRVFVAPAVVQPAQHEEVLAAIVRDRAAGGLVVHLVGAALVGERAWPETSASLQPEIGRPALSRSS